MKKLSLFISVLFVLAFMSSAFAGSISGRVTTTGGQGIDNIEVTATALLCGGGGPSGSDRTDTGGNYAIEGLPQGPYYIASNCCGDPHSNNHTFEWWNNNEGTTYCENAVAVNINAEENKIIDFQLEEAGAISGFVTSTNGEPIPNIGVSAYPSQCFASDPTGWSIQTDGSGYYEIGSLLPGTYYILSNLGDDEYHAREWWDGYGEKGTIDCEQARTVTVDADQTTENINFQLDPAGTISGRINKSDGTPITGVQFEVWAFQGENPCSGSQRMGIGWTDPDNGTYTLISVPAGDYYYLRTWNRDESYYLDEWWAAGSSVYDCNFAESFTVEPGADITGKDFQLEEGGTISGTITDIFGNPMGWPVLFFSGCERPPIIGTWSNGNGMYMSEVPAGDVYVASFWPL